MIQKTFICKLGPWLGPGVNNKELFSVKVLCHAFTTAYISVTTRFIVFVVGTWYICSISLDMKGLSYVPRPLSGARGQ